MKQLIYSTLGLIMVCLMTLTVKGQVIALMKPNSGFQMHIEDLYQLTLTNIQEDLSCQMAIKVKSDGRLVYESNVSSFQLSKGVNNMSISDFNIKSENIHPGYAYESLSRNKEFPFGNYEICYYFTNPSTLESLGENCEWRQIEPSTPILLNLPAESSVVTTLNPLFTWFPPTPISQNGFLYQFTLVEILGMQSPQEAIKRNPPIHMADKLPLLSYSYPFNAMNLENHKSYAWQVIVPQNRKVDSEIFPFRIELDSGIKEEKVVFNENFIILNGNQPQSGLNIKNQLRIVFPVSDKIGNISYDIFDIQGNKISEDNKDYISNLGDNRFVINLSASQQLKSKSYYQIKIHYPGQKQESVIAFRFYSL